MIASIILLAWDFKYPNEKVQMSQNIHVMSLCVILETVGSLDMVIPQHILQHTLANGVYYRRFLAELWHWHWINNSVISVCVTNWHSCLILPSGCFHQLSSNLNFTRNIPQLTWLVWFFIRQSQVPDLTGSCQMLRYIWMHSWSTGISRLCFGKKN